MAVAEIINVFEQFLLYTASESPVVSRSRCNRAKAGVLDAERDSVASIWQKGILQMCQKLIHSQLYWIASVGSTPSYCYNIYGAVLHTALSPAVRARGWACIETGAYDSAIYQG